MRKSVLYIFTLILSLSSCDVIFSPEDSIDPHGIFFSIDGDIYKMDYDGSNVIQITCDEKDNNNPHISHNGKYLIYETQANINRYPSGGLMYDYSVINIMDLKNKSVRTITDETTWCFQPHLSPDNHFVVFRSQKFNQGGSIVISDINGKKYKSITDYNQNRYPMFTPQGNDIIYIADQDQKTNIYKIDLDGKNKQQLTDSEWNINPTFSPDGSKILWEGYRDIFIMNIDGSNKINISDHTNIFARTPSFSHSGDKIVFITEKTYNVPIEESIREIHLIDLITNERKILLEEGANFEPKFFPDDDKIIFGQYEDKQLYICTINIDSSDFCRLCRGSIAYVY